MTKTISLADDAYDALTLAKREGESFSEVVRRLAKEAAMQDLFDPDLRLEMSDEEAEDALRRIYAARDATMTPRAHP